MSVWTDRELAETRNEDRILPSQPYNTKLYDGTDFCGDLAKLLSHPAKAWDIKLKDSVTYAALGSELNTLHFYQFLIRLRGYSRALELGTYIGVSAMYLSDAGAEVDTIEKGEEFYNIAKGNIERNGFQNSVRVHHADAIEFLKGPYRRYDFILIDAAKEAYKELLELSMELLMPNGLIVMDDVFFQGETLNRKQVSDKGKGVKAALDYAYTLEDWDKVILPIGNGLLLMSRK